MQCEYNNADCVLLLGIECNTNPLLIRIPFGSLFNIVPCSFSADIFLFCLFQMSDRERERARVATEEKVSQNIEWKEEWVPFEMDMIYEMDTHTKTDRCTDHL